MSIQLMVGKFSSSIHSVTNADGSSNTSLSLNAQSGNGATLRVRVNPSNNREVGVLALDVSSGVNAIVSVALPGGSRQVSTTFENVAAPPPPTNQEAFTAGGWSAPSDPPAWML